VERRGHQHLELLGHGPRASGGVARR
jgi:hypothetical protein